MDKFLILHEWKWKETKKWWRYVIKAFIKLDEFEEVKGKKKHLTIQWKLSLGQAMECQVKLVLVEG